ncbi:hypothetical protein [Actinomadura sp. DC4]|uniref:hypothetical protein n=1 Tax=Actinomadura sp. DC4 TaxID=3055069 RepID=UPI0025B199F7|nr:hypothetical protein [Actinomadura sp. DC4]MDN3353853.1 hypothetical protein [Actinomadura sp. DC4]
MTRLAGNRYARPPSSAGRTLRWLPISMAVLLVAGAGGGWAYFHFTKPATAVCGVVTDTSSSATDITTPGLSVRYERSQIEAHLPGFLLDENCDTVRLAAVTGDTERNACPVTEITVQPPKTLSLGETGRKQYVADRRKSALADAEQMAGVATGPATCAPGAGGSDILGALKRVAEGRPRPSRVIVFSDLAENARSLDGDSLFYGAPPKVMTESPQHLVAALERLRRVPDLHGVHLTLHGGCKELPHANRRLVTYDRCTTFWNEIFDGADGVDGWGK